MKKAAALVCILVGAAVAGATWSQSRTSEERWPEQLMGELQGIDAAFDGNMGVYVKRLSTGREFSYQAERPWYLASTIKVFVAAALLNEVDQGKVKLDEEVILRSSDFVDGSGDVIWKEPGEKLKLSYLLQQMLTKSDSTATDILIRRLGSKDFNSFVQLHLPGFGKITTIQDVRKHAYMEAHPKARILTNLDFIAFKKVPPSQRMSALAKRIRLKESALKVNSVEEAFERYYQRGMNSGSLAVYGHFIEQLLGGRVLSPSSTQLLVSLMESSVTGETRIKAGLPKGSKFAQKTGTQINRMCNVGRITAPDDSEQLVVTMCIEGGSGGAKAQEAVFKKVGEALTRSGVI